MSDAVLDEIESFANSSSDSFESLFCPNEASFSPNKTETNTNDNTGRNDSGPTWDCTVTIVNTLCLLSLTS